MSIKLPPENLTDKFDARLLASRKALAMVPNYHIAIIPTGRVEHRLAIRGADGSLVLLRVGPKGGVKELWRFGTIADVPSEDGR